MAKKTKWKGTAKQRAALKKGQRALAKWRREQGFKNPRKRKKIVRRRKVARKIRARPRSKVTRARASRAATGLFHVKDGRRYFTGTGFSATPGNAAYFKSKRRAATIARLLSNQLRKPIGVYG